jgi:hypothetical protein
VQQATKVEMAVNFKTAKALWLTFLTTPLARAYKVTE